MIVPYTRIQDYVKALNDDDIIVTKKEFTRNAIDTWCISMNTSLLKFILNEYTSHHRYIKLPFVKLIKYGLLDDKDYTNEYVTKDIIKTKLNDLCLVHEIDYFLIDKKIKQITSKRSIYYVPQHELTDRLGAQDDEIDITICRMTLHGFEICLHRGRTYMHYFDIVRRIFKYYSEYRSAQASTNI